MDGAVPQTTYFEMLAGSQSQASEISSSFIPLRAIMIKSGESSLAIDTLSNLKHNIMIIVSSTTDYESPLPFWLPSLPYK
jgi:hypothetical protein